MDLSKLFCVFLTLCHTIQSTQCLGSVVPLAMFYINFFLCFLSEFVSFFYPLIVNRSGIVRLTVSILGDGCHYSETKSFGRQRRWVALSDVKWQNILPRSQTKTTFFQYTFNIDNHYYKIDFLLWNTYLLKQHQTYVEWFLCC